MSIATASRSQRFLTIRCIAALVLREMSTTYGRSPGGYAWAILQPVAGIALFTLVLSFLARTPPLGMNFPLFYATGLLALAMYQDLSQKIGSAITYSRPLLTYPRVTYIDAILARMLLEVLTNVLVALLILGGIVFFYGLNIKPDFLKIASAVLMITALGLGLGLMNCFLISVFPIWAFIWAVLNRPMFLVSGIFYVIDFLPHTVRDLLLYNPVAHVIMELRAGIYSTYDGTYVSHIYVYGFAAVPGLFGLLLLHRYHNDILEV